MTSTQIHAQQLQDRFGRLVAARLEAGSSELPYDIGERLRAARTQALTQRKRDAAMHPATVVAGNGGGTLTFGEGSLWSRIASIVPIVALVAGLVLIHKFENDWRASEVAEVDAALLTDDLPPSAYADPGFIEFLKSDQK